MSEQETQIKVGDKVRRKRDCVGDTYWHTAGYDADSVWRVSEAQADVVYLDGDYSNTGWKADKFVLVTTPPPAPAVTVSTDHQGRTYTTAPARPPVVKETYPTYVTINGRPYPGNGTFSIPNPVLPSDSAERKNLPLATGCLDYFPAALAAVAELSKKGNDKHNPGEPLHHARGKSADHADCIVRHLMDRSTVDPEDGIRHSVKVAWRALALLQEELEAAGAPKARGAK